MSTLSLALLLTLPLAANNDETLEAQKLQAAVFVGDKVELISTSKGFKELVDGKHDWTVFAAKQLRMESLNGRTRLEAVDCQFHVFDESGRIEGTAESLTYDTETNEMRLRNGEVHVALHKRGPDHENVSNVFNVFRVSGEQMTFNTLDFRLKVQKETADLRLKAPLTGTND